jgi:hypothetical protein
VVGLLKEPPEARVLQYYRFVLHTAVLLKQKRRLGEATSHQSRLSDFAKHCASAKNN